MREKTTDGHSVPSNVLLTDCPFFARFKQRNPDPGVCRIISINWEDKLISMTNGRLRYSPSFDEVEIVKDFTAAALNDVMDERARQDAKWGQQDHEASRWLMILGEEYGEACEAGCRVTFPLDPRCTNLAVSDLRNELVQVAAVAVAMIEAIDRASEPNKELETVQ